MTGTGGEKHQTTSERPIPTDPRRRKPTGFSTPHDSPIEARAPQTNFNDATTLMSAVEAVQYNMRKLSGLETQKVNKISQKFNLEKQIHLLESRLKKEKGILSQFPIVEKKIHQRLADLREEMRIIEEKQRQLATEQNDSQKTFNDAFVNALKTAVSSETKPNHDEISSAPHNDVDILLTRVRKLETLLESKAKQYDALDTQVTRLSDELVKVQAPVASADQLDAVSAAVDTAKIKLAGALKADIAASETKLIQEMESTKSEVEESIKSLHKKLNEFRAEQKGKDQALPTFIASSVTTSIASNLKEQIAEQLGRVTQRQETLEKGLKSLTEGRETLEKSLKSLTERQETLEKGVKELQESLKRSIDQINATQKIANDSGKTYQALESAIDLQNNTVMHISQVQNAAHAGVESISRQQDNHDKIISDLREIIEGKDDGTQLGLLNHLAGIEQKQVDLTAKLQQLSDNLLNEKDGDIPSLSKRMESVEMRISNLAKNSRANSVMPSSTSRAGSNEAVSPQFASRSLDTSILDQKIKITVEPIHKLLDLLKADIISLQQKSNKPDHTSSATQVLPRPITSAQANGIQADSVHPIHGTEDKIHMLEQAVLVCKQGLEELSKQHQNLTTVEMCKKILDEIRQMYPQISPASKEEIDNLRLTFQQLISRVNGLDGHVANFSGSLTATRTHVDSMASFTHGAATRAQSALEEVKNIKVDIEKAMERLKGGSLTESNTGEMRPTPRESVSGDVAQVNGRLT